MTMMSVVCELPILSSVSPFHYIFLCSWAQIFIYQKIYYSIKNNFIPPLRHINILKTMSLVIMNLILG